MGTQCADFREALSIGSLPVRPLSFFPSFLAVLFLISYVIFVHNQT